MRDLYNYYTLVLTLLILVLCVVGRYHEWRQLWDSHKVPGEKSRNDLRWHIRVSVSIIIIIIGNSAESHEDI